MDDVRDIVALHGVFGDGFWIMHCCAECFDFVIGSSFTQPSHEKFLNKQWLREVQTWMTSNTDAVNSGTIPIIPVNF